MGFQFNPPLLIAHLSSAFPVTMPFGFLFLLKNPTGPEKQKHFSGFFLLQKKNSRGSQFSGLCWILELDSVIFRLGFKEIWCEGFRATKLCAAMVCGCFSVLKWRKEERASSSSFQEQGIINNNVRLFSYNSLRSATRNFHPSSRIGGGGYGVVYRGVLRDDAQVAIKCLSAESRQGANEFLTEINVISRIRHPNLVELLGCCVEDNHRILVYEYLENNSLSKSLLGSRSKYVFLDWPTRVSICLGTATGLAFLHEEAEQQIVHRDIKASNILLDANFRPKIGDFGLAKLFPDNVTHLSTRVAGTEGYLAPEYALLGQLTKKADVYSFGVLLLEIISGRSSSKVAFGEQLLVLVEWVWKLREEERLLELVDPELTAYPEAEVMRFIKVALFCTQATAQQRPTMKQVVEMLSKEVHLNEKALTKPRPRMHATGKFGGTSSLEETSSSFHSEKRKKSTANPDITSTSSLIFDDSETQILPR